MRKVFLTTLLALSAVAASAQYQCNVQSATETTVTFRSTGYGKNAKTAAAAAELNAVKTLLFSGAPKTNFSHPFVRENKEEAEKKYDHVLQSLYESGYKDFVESSVTVAAFGKDAEKRKCTTVDVRIRAKQLRTWLENKGVVRKFGL